MSQCHDSYTPAEVEEPVRGGEEDVVVTQCHDLPAESTQPDGGAGEPARENVLSRA